LSQNYPNPFNPRTVIRFQVSGNCDVLLKVYDVRGSEVQTLVNQHMQAGTYSVTFNGTGLNSGVYFYKMTANDYSETKKFHLIK